MTAPLTRFQQILVGTDGTVTRILEAYAGEPIEVVKLLQIWDRAEVADHLLEVSAGDGVLRRRVVLRGRRTRRSLLYAEAVVVLHRVDPAFLDGLVKTDQPIGTLLAQARTETFREVLAVGREPAGPCAELLGVDAAAEVVVRSYRIIAGRQPFVLITEKFPSESFQELLAEPRSS